MRKLIPGTGKANDKIVPDIKEIMQETKAEEKKQKSDQESRECNLNIHRAPESQNLNAKARSENDCTFFYDRCIQLVPLREKEPSDLDEK